MHATVRRCGWTPLPLPSSPVPLCRSYHAPAISPLCMVPCPAAQVEMAKGASVLQGARQSSASLPLSCPVRSTPPLRAQVDLGQRQGWGAVVRGQGHGHGYGCGALCDHGREVEIPPSSHAQEHSEKCLVRLTKDKKAFSARPQCSEAMCHPPIEEWHAWFQGLHALPVGGVMCKVSCFCDPPFLAGIRRSRRLRPPSMRQRMMMTMQMRMRSCVVSMNSSPTWLKSVKLRSIRSSLR